MINKLLDQCFLTELATEVKEVQEENGYFWHACKETIFYKEGGGMSSDIGVISNHEVLDLKIEDGKQWHLLDTRLEGNVFMSINLHERFRKCQIHTAQHLISALLHNIYNVDTLSHHVGDEENDVEFNLDHFTEKMAFELQVLCNGLIRDDLEIQIQYPNRQEASQFVSAEKLRHEDLRVVRIGTLDYNVCGCMHVPSLRYLQMLYILGYEKTKAGYKIHYICGDQLLDCVSKRYRVLDEASQTLALSHLYLNSGIHNLINDKKALQRDVMLWKQKYLEKKAQELAACDQALISAFFEDMDIKSLAQLGSMLAKDYKKAAVLCAKIYDNCHVVIASSEELDFDCEKEFKQLAEKFNLRGGGTAQMAQGGGIYQKPIKDYIKALENK